MYNKLICSKGIKIFQKGKYNFFKKWCTGWISSWEKKKKGTTTFLHTLFTFHLQSFPLVFSNESTPPIRWPKYWSFSFSISPSNEYSGLISLRNDWFYLFAVQRTLKSLLQQHNLKASILQCSAFFMVQLSHVCMTAGKIIALTTQTFVSKVMSLLFNMLSRFVIAFLPRSKCLLISYLQSPSIVILEPKKMKSVTVSISSPSVCHEVMGLARSHDFSFLNVEFCQLFHSLLSPSIFPIGLFQWVNSSHQVAKVLELQL